MKENDKQASTAKSSLNKILETDKKSESKNHEMSLLTLESHLLRHFDDHKPILTTTFLKYTVSCLLLIETERLRNTNVEIESLHSLFHFHAKRSFQVNR